MPALLLRHLPEFLAEFGFPPFRVVGRGLAVLPYDFLGAFLRPQLEMRAVRGGRWGGAESRPPAGGLNRGRRRSSS